MVEQLQNAPALAKPENTETLNKTFAATLRVFVASLIYLILAFIISMHTWSNPNHLIQCGCGDPSFFVWMLGNQAHGIFQHNPFIATTVSVPNGPNLMDATAIPIIGWIMAPITHIYSPTLSFNIANFAAPALDSISAFVFIRSIVKSNVSSFLGGLMFGFNPAILNSASTGDMQLTFLPMIPLIALSIYKIATEQSQTKYAIALGVAASIQVLIGTEMLALAFVLLITAVIVLVAINKREIMPVLVKSYRAFLISAIIFAVLSGYPLYFSLEGPKHTIQAIVQNVGFYGTPPNAFYSPTLQLGQTQPGSKLFGYLGPAPLQTQFVGWVIIFAFLVSFILLFKKYFWVRLTGILSIISIWYSLGGNLWTSFGRGPKYIEPWWLPWRWLGVTPILKDIVPQRTMFFFWLVAGVVLAFGVREISNVITNWLCKYARLLKSKVRELVFSFVSALVSFAIVIQIAILQPLPFGVIKPQLSSWYVDTTSKLPSDSIVFVGISNLESFELLYWQSETRFHVRLANNFSGIFVPDAVTPQLPSLQDYIDASYLGPQYQQVLISTFKSQLADSGVDAVVFQDAPANAYLIKIMQSISGYDGEVDGGGYLFLLNHSR